MWASLSKCKIDSTRQLAPLDSISWPTITTKLITHSARQSPLCSLKITKPLRMLPITVMHPKAEFSILEKWFLETNAPRQAPNIQQLPSWPRTKCQLPTFRMLRARSQWCLVKPTSRDSTRKLQILDQTHLKSQGSLELSSQRLWAWQAVLTPTLHWVTSAKRKAMTKWTAAFWSLNCDTTQWRPSKTRTLLLKLTTWIRTRTLIPEKTWWLTLTCITPLRRNSWITKAIQ